MLHTINRIDHILICQIISNKPPMAFIELWDCLIKLWEQLKKLCFISVIELGGKKTKYSPVHSAERIPSFSGIPYVTFFLQFFSYFFYFFNFYFPFFVLYLYLFELYVFLRKFATFFFFVCRVTTCEIYHNIRRRQTLCPAFC